MGILERPSINITHLCLPLNMTSFRLRTVTKRNGTRGTSANAFVHCSAGTTSWRPPLRLLNKYIIDFQ